MSKENYRPKIEEVRDAWVLWMYDQAATQGVPTPESYAGFLNILEELKEGFNNWHARELSSAWEGGAYYAASQADNANPYRKKEGYLAKDPDVELFVKQLDSHVATTRTGD
jgi:hypothetical protein